jgi:hypothetical protein
MWDRPAQAVTFVENHDVVRDNPISNDKLLAYAFILTHEGYPCVFWEDYFNSNLAQPDNQNGIDALIRVHEQNKRHWPNSSVVRRRRSLRHATRRQWRSKRTRVGPE